MKDTNIIFLLIQQEYNLNTKQFNFYDSKLPNKFSIFWNTINNFFKKNWISQIVPIWEENRNPQKFQLEKSGNTDKLY